MEIEVNGIVYKTIKDNELSVYKCTSLFPEISIPKSINADKEYVVSEIGEKAFQNCSNISSVILPDSLKSIRKGAFIKCSSLEKINIPKSVNEIGDYCFHECVSLKKINFASFAKLISIGFCAFYHCENLKSIFLPDSIVKIGKEAFLNCHNLEYVVLPKNLSIIDKEVFHSCSNLKPIKIPDSVKSIGYNSFYSCFNYNSILIPKGVESIDIHAFKNIDIISIYVNEDNRYYDSRDNCNAIIETNSNKLIVGCINSVIPDSVKVVDMRAFYYCGVKQVRIPDTVERIEMEYLGTSLEKIYVPANKKSYFMNQISSNYWDILDVF